MLLPPTVITGTKQNSCMQNCEWFKQNYVAGVNDSQTGTKQNHCVQNPKGNLMVRSTVCGSNTTMLLPPTTIGTGTKQNNCMQNSQGNIMATSTASGSNKTVLLPSTTVITCTKQNTFMQNPNGNLTARSTVSLPPNKINVYPSSGVGYAGLSVQNTSKTVNAICQVVATGDSISNYVVGNILLRGNELVNECDLLSHFKTTNRFSVLAQSESQQVPIHTSP
jgi:hypothetical protein